MDFDDYTAQAAEFAVYKNPLYPIIGLCAEVGELAELYQRPIRQGKDRSEDRLGVRDEIGDILWYLAAIGRENAVSLADAAQGNLMKLTQRYHEPETLYAGDARSVAVVDFLRTIGKVCRHYGYAIQPRGSGGGLQVVRADSRHDGPFRWVSDAVERHDAGRETD